VRRSTEAQVAAGTLAEGYGYQWWVDGQGEFMALGYAGQYIIVDPAHDLVVVFTSALPDVDFGIPEALYRQHVLGAIRSDAAIAADSQEQARLGRIVDRLAHPEPEPVPPLPPMAATVSGNVYSFEPNDADFHDIGLRFEPGASEAQLTLAYRDRDLRLGVGLDGVYRVAFQHLYWRAYRGRWESDDTFLLEYQVADFSEWGWLRLSFQGDSVRVQFRNERSGYGWELTAT